MVRWRRSRAEWISLLVVAGLLATIVPFGFSSNQATFSLFAEQALDGEVLYRDVIDLKQPGIFVFFGLAQLPFGPQPAAVHLVEALVWLAFAAWMQTRLRPWFRHELVAATAPVALVGLYVIAAGVRDLLQPDALVTIPILIAIHHGIEARSDETRRWVIAGIATTAVAYLKLPYAVIPVLCWLPNVIGRLRSDAGVFLRRAVLPTTGAVALTLAPFAVYAVVNGVATELWALWFEWASERTELWPRERDRLVAVIRRGVRLAAPFGLLALGGFGLVDRDRLRQPAVLALAAWFAVAVPLFGAQLWFGYHLWLFLGPVALLGWLGLDALLSEGRRLALGIVVVSLLVGASQLGPDLIDRGVLLATNELGLTSEGRSELRTDLDPDHALAEAYAEWVRTNDHGDRGWALGATLETLHAAEQDHAVPIIGFAPLLLRPDDWATINRSLDTDPPDTIVLDENTRADLLARSPGTLDRIETGWRRTGGAGPLEFWERADGG